MYFLAKSEGRTWQYLTWGHGVRRTAYSDCSCAMASCARSVCLDIIFYHMTSVVGLELLELWIGASGAGRLFPDRLTSTRGQAPFTSFHDSIFYRIAWAGQEGHTINKVIDLQSWPIGWGILHWRRKFENSRYFTLKISMLKVSVRPPPPL